ncbi:MAG: nicotinate-nucleotide adenylyltransferase [Gammaproteobacteria bacterium]|nr:nicotinate-nucleotide adenylyltransferase [Gammaproteobacteria bacterium]MDH3465777.1 nicotinate-nucleotide adenylyltransferase [Gammaproteobacteria bacterium]
MSAPLGIFGGTFDPIHYGHLRSVEFVAQKLRLQQVCFVPVATPAHRSAPQAHARHRLAMLELALATHPRFRVDTREIDRGGPSYTVPTLQSFRDEDPARPLCLLLGVDAFLHLPTWHRWRELWDLAHIAVMRRPGWSAPATLPDWWQQHRCNGEFRDCSAGCIVTIETPLLDIQATVIRQHLRAGIDASDAVPVAVLEYARRHRLYEATTGESMHAV